MNELCSECKCESCIFKNLLFEDVQIPELTSICKKKRVKKYLKGDCIISEGDEIREFIYLKVGLVKLYKQHPNEQDQIIRIARPSNFIGLLSVFSETNYKYSVTAIENSEVCIIELSSIKELIIHNGNFALNVLRKISQTADDIIKTNLEISKKNLRGRIAYILLYFSKQVYNSEAFELPVSRKEIAQLIEMTTENVIRIISEFAKDNVLKVEKKKIEILDIVKLQKICDLG